MKKVLLTGAAGMLGKKVRRLLAGTYDELRLTDISDPGELAPGETFVAADLSDAAAVEKAVEGIDGIIHLGGLSLENDWSAILKANIDGTYNVFEAAKRAGVKRVVFASSHQAVGFYRRTRRIGTDVPVRPSGRYGVSKAVGEAIGALYADKYGLGVFCIRIGRCFDYPEDERRLSIWLQPEDLIQLCRIGLEHPDVHYEIVYGVSGNTRGWFDNERAYELGYRPVGNAEDHFAKAMEGEAARPMDAIGKIFYGARFCASEFAGDLDKAGT